MKVCKLKKLCCFIGMNIEIFIVLFFCIKGNFDFGKIYISATGTYNSEAYGKEIWIKEIILDGNSYNVEEFLIKGRWIKNENYVIWRDYNVEEQLTSEIVISVPKANTVSVVFQSNCWRGKVKIAYGGKSEILDTYATTEDGSSSVNYDIDSESLWNYKSLKENVKMILIMVLISIGCAGILCVTDNEMYKITKKRELWMDLLKILSAYAIVIIHISGELYYNSYAIDEELYMQGLYMNTITRFAVPSFMMVSGALLLSKNRDCHYTIKKCGIMITLLLGWSIVYLLMKKWLWQPDLDLKSEILTIPFEAKNGHLWYAYQMVWIYILLPIFQLLYNVMNNKMKRYFFLVTLIIPSFVDYIVRMFTNMQMDFVPSTSINISVQYIALVFWGKYLYDLLNEKQGICKWYVACGIVYIGISMLIISTWVLSDKRGYATDELFFELKFPVLVYATGIYLMFLSLKRKIEKKLCGIEYYVGVISDSLLTVYFGHCALQWFTNDLYLKNCETIILVSMVQYMTCILLFCTMRKLFKLKKNC